MDNLLSKGKEFFEDKVQGSTGSSGNNTQGGGFFGDDDDRKAQQEAASRAGSSGSGDMFSSIISSLGGKKSQIANDNLDEEDAIRKHNKNYVDDDDDDDDDDADDSSLGTAAAMQALKMFNKGETGSDQSKGAFLGLAMSEASKLYDSKAAKGKVSSSSSKESAVQQAGEMAMKMYFKSQAEQSGGLMGFASKFM